MLERFLACAKRTAIIFDPVEAVLSMKWLSPGCTLVTLRSNTKWHMSSPECTKKTNVTLEKLKKMMGGHS